VTLSELLDQVAAIKGVGSAAVVSGEGFLLEGSSNNDVDLDFVGGLIASGMASSRALASLLGEGEVQQAMIEYDQGPVLLLPLGDADEQGYTVVVTLDDASTLGRVRFHLRRLLPAISEQVAA
jgi:predicted regulator of Ras-like GTPase activity (Roadblock/LC7/MglB family)